MKLSRYLAHERFDPAKYLHTEIFQYIISKVDGVSDVMCSLVNHAWREKSIPCYEINRYKIRLLNSKYIFAGAIDIDYKNIITWTLEQKFIYHYKIRGEDCKALAKEGFADVIMLLYDRCDQSFNNMNYVNTVLFRAAIENKNNKLIKLLMSHHIPVNIKILKKVITIGDVELLKSLLRYRWFNRKCDDLCFAEECLRDDYNGGICGEEYNICNKAARENQFECLKLLREQKKAFAWNDRIYEHGVRCGNIEMLKWIRQNGLQLGSGTKLTDLAAKHRRLDIFKWLVVEQHYPLREDIYRYFRKKKDIEIFKFLHSIGFYLSNNLLFNCVINGHIQVLDWIVSTSKFDIAKCYKVAKRLQSSLVKNEDECENRLRKLGKCMPWLEEKNKELEN